MGPSAEAGGPAGSSGAGGRAEGSPGAAAAQRRRRGGGGPAPRPTPPGRPVPPGRPGGGRRGRAGTCRRAAALRGRDGWLRGRGFGDSPAQLATPAGFPFALRWAHASECSCVLLTVVYVQSASTRQKIKKFTPRRIHFTTHPNVEELNGASVWARPCVPLWAAAGVAQGRGVRPRAPTLRPASPCRCWPLPPHRSGQILSSARQLTRE